jgi:hypothetical protein
MTEKEEVIQDLKELIKMEEQEDLLDCLEDLVGQFQMKKINEKQVVNILESIVNHERGHLYENDIIS